MQRKSKRNMFFFVALLVAIFLVIGFCIWNKPHHDIQNAVALKTNAVVLYSVLSSNSSSAKSNFNNKVLSVSGTVKQVLENHQKQQVILLKTNVSGGAVNCTMEENFQNVSEGDSVLIKGICIGYNSGVMNLPGDVFLIRCYNVE